MHKELAEYNQNKLKNNPYPGRGIIIGLSPDKSNYIQVYWIMGRSENSRNRIFVNDNQIVKTKAYDESKVEDPSLIIYNAIRQSGHYHIVSNGDQTDTIYDKLEMNKIFEESLNERTYEPDAPNFTPRISGVVNTSDSQYAYQLSILKTIQNNPDLCTKQFFNYQKGCSGYGHCIHTYETDGNPLPSFNGEPYIVQLFDSIEETSNFYWDMLNYDNKISLVVKYIDIATNDSTITIVNKHN